MNMDMDMRYGRGDIQIRNALEKSSLAQADLNLNLHFHMLCL